MADGVSNINHAEALKKKKLLLVGPSANSVHLENYHRLVADAFGEVLVVTDQPITFAPHKLVSFRFNLGLFKNIRYLRKIIKEFRPDVVHVHQANTCAFVTVRANRRRVPLVVTCWGSDVLLMPQRGFISRFVVKHALSGASVITADANYVIEAAKTLVADKKFLVANFGIDVSSVEIPKKEKIIFSNRLHKDLYNIGDIITGFAAFSKKNPDWKLVIGGSGELTDSLKNQASSELAKDRFEVIGFVPSDENRRQYLRAAVWVSVPSSDGTAISLLEAMAYGCIPVVSDLPANREWISNGDNGIVVTADVSQALNEAIKLSSAEVQRKNMKIILERGTKSVNRSKFIAMYGEILSKG
jgi:glycosyltransferase involved in cell wall biosynthesis